MFHKFYELFNALNEEALNKVDEDLSLIEASMREVLDAWIDYMMTRTEAPTKEESNMFYECQRIVQRF